MTATAIVGICASACLAQPSPRGLPSHIEPQGHAPIHPLATRDKARFVPFEKIPEYLKRIAAQCRANFDKIRFWEADFDIQDTTFLEQLPPWLKAETRVAWERAGIGKHGLFKEDQGKLHLLANDAGDFRCDVTVTRSRFRDAHTLAEYEDPDASHPFQQKSIVANDDYLHFEPNILDHGPSMFVPSDAKFPQSGRMAFCDPKLLSDGQQWGVVVDPRKFFSRDDGRTFVWDELLRIATAIEGNSIEGIQGQSGRDLIRMERWGTDDYEYALLSLTFFSSR
jgi:hypothetical protein